MSITGGMKEIEDKVKKILSTQLSVPVDRINLGALLLNDLSMDSFSAIEVAFALGTEFDIEIGQDEIVQFKTVGDIVEKIREVTGAQK